MLCVGFEGLKCFHMAQNFNHFNNFLNSVCGEHLISLLAKTNDSVFWSLVESYGVFSEHFKCFTWLFEEEFCEFRFIEVKSEFVEFLMENLILVTARG